MMAAIQMNNDKGQVTRLFSSPVTSAERETCQDEGKVNDASMHVQELSSEKCDTASKNGENGYVQRVPMKMYILDLTRFNKIAT